MDQEARGEWRRRIDAMAENMTGYVVDCQVLGPVESGVCARQDTRRIPSETMKDVDRNTAGLCSRLIQMLSGQRYCEVYEVDALLAKTMILSILSLEGSP